MLKTATAGLAVGAVALTGCGGGSSSDSSSSASGATTDVAAAKTAITDYTGKPTAFPVDEPLKRKPVGKTFAYLQCSTPACALFAQIAAPTQKLLGYKLNLVKAGSSANEAQS